MIEPQREAAVIAAAAALDRKAHWEQVYQQKDEADLSWHQDDPRLSFALVSERCPPGGAALDVGGGSSLLAARLAAAGREVTVLDISPAALRRAQERSGPLSGRIRWLAADVLGPDALPGPFDVWHDRAVFHFLVDPEERRRYAARALAALRPGGHLVLATFAPDGPERCSGLPVQRWDAAGLARELGPGFAVVDSLREVHVTPWGSEQAFAYAVLRRE